MEIKLDFLAIIFGVLLVLKLFFVPTIPWWCVFLPLIPTALFLVIWMVTFIGMIIGFLIAWIFG